MTTFLGEPAPSLFIVSNSGMRPPGTAKQKEASMTKVTQYRIAGMDVSGDGLDAPPSCAAADHSGLRSLPAGKIQHPLSRPNGRPSCRLSPIPTPPLHICVQNDGFRSENAGGDWRCAYETLAGRCLDHPASAGEIAIFQKELAAYRDTLHRA